MQPQSFGQAYTEQKDLLDRLHEKSGVDVSVASYGGTQDKNGQVRSYAVWTQGVVSLLPQTDLVGFMREGREPLVADFAT
jgi:hypothetical protein